MSRLEHFRGLQGWRRLNPRHVFTDIFLILASLYLSLFLRLGTDEFHEFFHVLNKHAALYLVIRLGTFVTLGVYDIIWRYFSTRDAMRLGRAVLLSSVLIVASSYIVDIGRLPRAVFFIDSALVLLLLGGIRFFRRWLYEQGSIDQLRRSGSPALIFGAGSNGRTLANRFSTDGSLGLNLIGFVDDDPQKMNRRIAGVRVLGNREDLGDLIAHFGVREVIIAVARPSGKVLREVVQTCRAHNVLPRIISGSQSERRNDYNLTREVGLSDLLNRPRKNMSNQDLKSLLRGKRVLVTGAGGSIGSELARQVHSFGPEQLLILDHSELNLYEIDRELRLSSQDRGAVIPLLMDIKDRKSLRQVFTRFRPEIVFHAAAYKHVHLVEFNAHSAILNNVIGTRNLLDLSREGGVDTFLMISTDKAVNPGGIMGATKRFCELMVTEVGELEDRRYCSVRFGNVLGSSGSLIPLLKKQIAGNEPLTITHERMTRYFMLIPEAVSLVLKAATIARHGDITLLKMGEPVRIVDIARSLRAMMGKTDDECPIVFTGLRPGEKIHEELYTCGNEIETSDPDILVVPRGDNAKDRGQGYLAEAAGLEVLCENQDPEAVERLKKLVDFKQVQAVESDVRVPSDAQPPTVWN